MAKTEKMKNQNYAEQVKDPRWQRKKNSILERDGYMCRNCGNDKNTLHVHHQYYEFGKNIWDYPDESLITLCEDCHKEITQLDKQIKEGLRKVEASYSKETILGAILALQDTHDTGINYRDRKYPEMSFSTAQALIHAMAIVSSGGIFPYNEQHPLIKLLMSGIATHLDVELLMSFYRNDMLRSIIEFNQLIENDRNNEKTKKFLEAIKEQGCIRSAEILKGWM